MKTFGRVAGVSGRWERPASRRPAGRGSGGAGTAPPRGRGSREEGIFTEQLFLCCAEQVLTPGSAPADPTGSPWTRPVPRCRGRLQGGSLVLAHPPRGSASPSALLPRKQRHPRRYLLYTDSSVMCASVSVPGVVMTVHFLP